MLHGIYEKKMHRIGLACELLTWMPAWSAGEPRSTPVTKIPRPYSAPPRIIRPRLSPISSEKST